MYQHLVDSTQGILFQSCNGYQSPINCCLTWKNESLSGKVDGFTDGDYAAVTGLAYDTTNKKLGLKVGADTVIPFSKGGGKLVKIGSISLPDWSGSNSTTIDCTRLDSWESMTNDSFAVVLTSSSIHSWSTRDVKIDRSGGINAAKSYNASIGKLTVSCSGTQTHTYHGGGAHSYTTTNGSFDIYAVQ